MELLDEHLYIEKVLGGDTAAYSHIVNKHKDMVYSLALKITGNHEEAEEIAQDAFVKAYQSLHTFRQESKFSTWLYRIVYNTAVTYKRKRKPEMLPVDEHMIEKFTLDNIHDNVDSLSEDEQKNLIEMALGHLQPEENVIITLYYMEEHSVGEISKIMGYTVSNVKVKLHRARKKLYTVINRLYVNHYNIAY